LSDLADAMETLGIRWKSVLGNASQIPFHPLAIFATEEAADSMSQR
jgi:hypothetical protein